MRNGVNQLGRALFVAVLLAAPASHAAGFLRDIDRGYDRTTSPGSQISQFVRTWFGHGGMGDEMIVPRP